MKEKIYFNSSGENVFDAEEQWRDFLAGDLSSLGNIFEYFYNDLYYYGLACCQRKALVKDSIQEVFATINQRRENLSAARSVKAYIMSSLRRRLLQKLKTRRNRRNQLDAAASFEDAFQLSPEQIFIKAEANEHQQRQIRKAIQMLPPRQKEILLLRYFHGMSYREIEEIASINYQSIRNHIYRATKKLRSILDDSNFNNIRLLKASSL